MKHDTKQTISAVFLIVIVLLTATAVGATYDPGAIAPPEDERVLSILADVAQRATEPSWTPQRRSLAQPPAMGEVTPESLAGAVTRQEPLPTGTPGFIPGSLPQPGANAEARTSFPEEWAEAAAEARAVAAEDSVNSETKSASASSGAYTAFYANKYPQMWKLYPYKAIGKLYFDTPGGPAYCTASVIGPDLIVTAAQCILDTHTDTFYTNFAFCPAAKGSACPYGTFAWIGIVLQNAFLEATSWADVVNIDVALVQLDSNRVGRSVHTYTGWLGRAWNLPPDQHAIAFGYPVTKQGSPFSLICAGGAMETSIDILEMGCDSGFGHLGGPWLVHFAPYVAKSANYINSVTSYQYTRGGNAVGGPRFTLENIAKLCDVVAQC
jgi:V8-like Glu-specific endopeptidase